MKKILFTLLLSFCVLHIFAQPEIQVLGARNPNELIVGKNNIVTITSLRKDAKVRMTRGVIQPLGNYEYRIYEKYCSFPEYDTLIISQGPDILEQKKFKLKYYGAPLLAIDNNTCTDSMKGVALSNGITIVPDSLHYKVTQFEMTVAFKRGETVGPLLSNRGEFSAQQYRAMGRLIKGNVVYIENI